MFTAKSPVVASDILRFEPDAGVIPIVPVLISDGVETEVDDNNFVADSVSVENVRSESSIKIPVVPAKVTLVAVSAEFVMFPPTKVVYVADPNAGVTKVGLVENTRLELVVPVVPVVALR